MAPRNPPRHTPAAAPAAGQRTSASAQVGLAASSLDDLLAQARDLVLRAGAVHRTQRGSTRSLNGVTLTWRDPERDRSPRGQWQQADVDWYLDVFVASRPENDPARPASPGALLFPYTYAARTRFWDGGWGYLVALVAAMRAEGVALGRVVRSRRAFERFLDAMGERLHLQTVLGLCALYPPPLLRRWLRDPATLGTIAARWRRDTLAAAIRDVAETPHTRRALVSSFGYPQLEDQLEPRMGLPPYQLFQLLPGEVGGPLDSSHVHRSLDVGGGAPLDFCHDLAWLREASARLGRAVGDITVVAQNLHAYLPERAGERAGAAETIQQWLCRVTDGYAAGTGVPAVLRAQPAYHANIERVWALWH
jgi:hypothetical protein